MKKIALLLVVLFVAGCAQQQTAKKIQTKSGKPEVTIATADVDTFRSVLLSQMISTGKTVDNNDRYSMAFSKEVDTMGGWFLQMMASGNSPTPPRAQVVFTFATAGETTTIYGSAFFLSRGMTGREDRRDVTNGNAADIQELMNRALKGMEGSPIHHHDTSA